MKKAAKTQKTHRSRKGAIKDLEPKANPKGGTESVTLNFHKVDGVGGIQLPSAIKVARFK